MEARDQRSTAVWTVLFYSHAPCQAHRPSSGQPKFAACLPPAGSRHVASGHSSVLNMWTGSRTGLHWLKAGQIRRTSSVTPDWEASVETGIDRRTVRRNKLLRYMLNIEQRCCSRAIWCSTNIFNLVSLLSRSAGDCGLHASRERVRVD